MSSTFAPSPRLPSHSIAASAGEASGASSAAARQPKRRSFADSHLGSLPPKVMSKVVSSLAPRDFENLAYAIHLSPDQTISKTAQMLGVSDTDKKRLSTIKNQAKKVFFDRLRNGESVQKTLAAFNVPKTDNKFWSAYTTDWAELFALFPRPPSEGNYLIGVFSERELKSFKDEIRKGRSPLDFALQRGITRPEGIFKAEAIAIEAHKDDIRADQTVTSMAELWGITTPQGIEALEAAVTGRFAGAKVTQGQNVREVAAQHGITTPRGLRYLESFAISDSPDGMARSQLKAGAHMKSVAAQHGIQSTYVLKQMEQLVLKNPKIEEQLLNKEKPVPVSEMVRSLGVTDPVNISKLEVQVISELGFKVTDQGMSPQAFAQLHGIHTLIGLRQLKQLAAERV
jgi:hypothetical protein